MSHSGAHVGAAHAGASGDGSGETARDANVMAAAVAVAAAASGTGSTDHEKLPRSRTKRRRRGEAEVARERRAEQEAWVESRVQRFREMQRMSCCNRACLRSISDEQVRAFLHELHFTAESTDAMVHAMLLSAKRTRNSFEMHLGGFGELCKRAFEAVCGIGHHAFNKHSQFIREHPYRLLPPESAHSKRFRSSVTVHGFREAVWAIIADIARDFGGDVDALARASSSAHAVITLPRAWSIVRIREVFQRTFSIQYPKLQCARRTFYELFAKYFPEVEFASEKWSQSAAVTALKGELLDLSRSGCAAGLDLSRESGHYDENLARFESQCTSVAKRIVTLMDRAAALRAAVRDGCKRAAAELSEMQTGDRAVEDFVPHYSIDVVTPLWLPQHRDHISSWDVCSLRQVRVVGVLDDASQHQRNFAFYDDVQTGTDQSLVSLLDMFLTRYRLEKTRRYTIHSDGTLARSRDFSLFAYHAFRILAREVDEVRHVFGVPGHTTNHVEANFEALRPVYRGAVATSLEELGAAMRTVSGQHSFTLVNAAEFLAWEAIFVRYFTPIKDAERYSVFEFRREGDDVVVECRCTPDDVQPHVQSMLAAPARSFVQDSEFEQLCRRAFAVMPKHGVSRLLWEASKISLEEIVSTVAVDNPHELIPSNIALYDSPESHAALQAIESATNAQL